MEVEVDATSKKADHQSTGLQLIMIRCNKSQYTKKMFSTYTKKLSFMTKPFYD